MKQTQVRVLSVAVEGLHHLHPLLEAPPTCSRATSWWRFSTSTSTTSNTKSSIATTTTTSTKWTKVTATSTSSSKYRRWNFSSISTSTTWRWSRSTTSTSTSRCLWSSSTAKTSPTGLHQQTSDTPGEACEVALASCAPSSSLLPLDLPAPCQP